MTDTEEIERIREILRTIDFDEYTRQGLDDEINELTINDIKDNMWSLYCFLSDIRHVLGS